MDKETHFWQWFSQNNHRLKKLTPNNSTINELENQIKKLGQFVWEVGPGIKKEFSFILSPAGDKDLLVQSKKILAKAPSYNEWELYYAKQPKEWKGFFDVVLNGRTIRIDISDWRYVLFQYNDNTFDIIIKPLPFIKHLGREINGIAEMVVDSLVGEEIRIDKIPNIEIVEEFESDIKKNSSSLLDLQKHLKIKTIS